MIKDLKFITHAKRTVQISHRVLTSSSSRLVSTISSESNNAQEIEKLNKLVKKKLTEIKEDEKRNTIGAIRPKLFDFTRPLLLTLLLGSTICLNLHWIWWSLEYDARETELKDKLSMKEAEFQKILETTNNKTKNSTSSGGKNFWSKLIFW